LPLSAEEEAPSVASASASVIFGIPNISFHTFYSLLIPSE